MMALKMKPRWISPEEYLTQEELATVKSEYFKGQIFAMAGGSANHETIAGNTFVALHQFARTKSCRAFSSNLRVLVQANGLYTYPDAMLICGQLQFVPGRTDTVTNPLLLVEVLSSSTEHYDRGDKFELYRGISTFAYYVLIHQERIFVELFQKVRGGWLLTEVQDRQASLVIDDLGLVIPLNAIYEGVDWLTP